MKNFQTHQNASEVFDFPSDDMSMHPPSLSIGSGASGGYDDPMLAAGNYVAPQSAGSSFKSLSGLSSPYTSSPTPSRRRGRGRKAGGNSGDRMPQQQEHLPKDMASTTIESPSTTSNSSNIFPDMNGIFGSGRKARGAGKKYVFMKKKKF